jgi:nucleoside-triphosphatase THEP1
MSKERLSLVVSGKQGSGKSRLAKKIAFWLASEGYPVTLECEPFDSNHVADKNFPIVDIETSL